MNVARECAVSAAINGTFSFVFFQIAFGGGDPVPLWGIGNYAFDFIPQGAAIGLMSSLVPGLLARRQLHAVSVGAVVRRSIVHTLAGICGAVPWALLLYVTGSDAIGFTAALLIKIFYGAVLGAVSSWIMLESMKNMESI